VCLAETFTPGDDRALSQTKKGGSSPVWLASGRCPRRKPNTKANSTFGVDSNMTGSIAVEWKVMTPQPNKTLKIEWQMLG